jgi:hypothetical protein
MEQRTNDLHLAYSKNVSPYNSIISDVGKEKLYSQYKSKVWLFWAIPLGLTFSEFALLKHGKNLQAKKLNLFKWISYILAGVATNFELNCTLKKTHFYDVIYPRAPQIQKEYARDAEILKNLHV